MKHFITSAIKKTTLAVCLFTITLCVSIQVKAQDKNYDPKSGPLYNEIMQQDSMLFKAFNSRDLAGMQQFFDPQMELYQDNQGVRDQETVMNAFAEMFKRDFVLTRTPVRESMEVYPIKDFGAIQSGRHIFSHVENGQQIVATFKFFNIWQKKDGKWHITRLVTYDHKL